MPNWCENDLVVSGSKDAVKAFQQAVFTAGEEALNGSDNWFDYNKIIPYPAKYKDTDRIRADWVKANTNPDGSFKEGITRSMMPYDGYNAGGYEWCCQTWGTKWPASNFSKPKLEFGARTAKFKVSYNTPWKPSIPILLEASRQHPQVTITNRYYEGGMCYKGVYKCKAGKVIMNTHSVYNGRRGG